MLDDQQEKLQRVQKELATLKRQLKAKASPQRRAAACDLFRGRMRLHAAARMAAAAPPSPWPACAAPAACNPRMAPAPHARPAHAQDQEGGGPAAGGVAPGVQAEQARRSIKTTLNSHMVYKPSIKRERHELIGSWGGESRGAAAVATARAGGTEHLPACPPAGPPGYGGAQRHRRECPNSAALALAGATHAPRPMHVPKPPHHQTARAG